MKGDAKVIEYLNKGLRSELTAINQYWLHFRQLNHWGYKSLAKKWREESIAGEPVVPPWENPVPAPTAGVG